MININGTKWFAREFPTGLPLVMLPNIIERLRSGPAAYEDRLVTVPNDILIRREGETWSIQENVGHVLDLESLWFGRLNDFITEKVELRPADLANTKTHEGNHNDGKLEELLTKFRDARFQLVGTIENVRTSVLNRTVLHPRLKTPMNIVDLAYFVAEHDIHHLTRISELLRTFSAKT